VGSGTSGAFFTNGIVQNLYLSCFRRLVKVISKPHFKLAAVTLGMYRMRAIADNTFK
jgi:hypothetical protein